MPRNTLISRGNLKLGVLPSFSLPPIKTCPGKTPFCDKYCFGLKGNYILQNVIDANERRLEASGNRDFGPIIVREIIKACTPAFRIHVVGDFYAVDYIEKWIYIASRLPDVVFFGSTRSWRPEKIGAAITRFRDMPNVSLRASVDLTDDMMPAPSWSTWSVEGEGQACPHDKGSVRNCYDCGRCWKNKDINTTFNLRWANVVDYIGDRYV